MTDPQQDEVLERMSKWARRLANPKDAQEAAINELLVDASLLLERLALDADREIMREAREYMAHLWNSDYHCPKAGNTEAEMCHCGLDALLTRMEGLT